MPDKFDWHRYRTKVIVDFDRNVVDLRLFYDSLEPEEKKLFQSIVERVSAVEEESLRKFGIWLPIGIPCKDFEMRWRHADEVRFPTWILLEALEAWGKGEEYAPINPMDRPGASAAE